MELTAVLGQVHAAPAVPLILPALPQIQRTGLQLIVELTHAVVRVEQLHIGRCRCHVRGCHGGAGLGTGAAAHRRADHADARGCKVDAAAVVGVAVVEPTFLVQGGHRNGLAVAGRVGAGHVHPLVPRRSDHRDARFISRRNGRVQDASHEDVGCVVVPTGTDVDDRRLLLHGIVDGCRHEGGAGAAAAVEDAQDEQLHAVRGAVCHDASYVGAVSGAIRQVVAGEGVAGEAVAVFGDPAVGKKLVAGVHPGVHHGHGGGGGHIAVRHRLLQHIHAHIRRAPGIGRLSLARGLQHLARVQDLIHKAPVCPIPAG